MPRQLLAAETFIDLLREVWFTRAALRAVQLDRLLAHCDDWEARILTVESVFREVEKASMGVEALRRIGDQDLDAAVLVFAMWLDASVGRDRASAAWRTWFRDATPTEFVRQAMADEAAAVKGWLSSSDPVLDPHRVALGAAVHLVEQASQQENELKVRRGRMWTAREELATFLTGSRDALEGELQQLGREQQRPRGWEASFFRVRSRSADPEVTPPTAPS